MWSACTTVIAPGNGSRIAGGFCRRDGGASHGSSSSSTRGIRTPRIFPDALASSTRCSTFALDIGLIADKGPLIQIRRTRFVDELAVARTSRESLKRQGNQIAEATRRD